MKVSSAEFMVIEQSNHYNSWNMSVYIKNFVNNALAVQHDFIMLSNIVLFACDVWNPVGVISVSN